MVTAYFGPSTSSLKLIGRTPLADALSVMPVFQIAWNQPTSIRYLCAIKAMARQEGNKVQLTQAYERVVYGVNPLIEVICQLRFPKLLKIDASAPAAFQAAIMNDYPDFEERDAVQIEVMPQSNAGPIQRTNLYIFASDDGNWTVTLSSDFLALTCARYVRWEDFRGRLEKIVEVLLDQYQILHFSRVGLRYRDVIEPSEFGLKDVAWSELIKPTVLGLAGDKELHDGKILSYMSALSMTMNGTHIVLNAGIIENNNTKEQAFLIDTDFSAEGKHTADTENVIKLANVLHGVSGPLFRWCITDKLHDSLRPEPV